MSQTEESGKMRLTPPNMRDFERIARKELRREMLIQWIGGLVSIIFLPIFIYALYNSFTIPKQVKKELKKEIVAYQDKPGRTLEYDYVQQERSPENLKRYEYTYTTTDNWKSSGVTTSDETIGFTFIASSGNSYYNIKSNYYSGGTSYGKSTVTMIRTKNPYKPIFFKSSRY